MPLERKTAPLWTKTLVILCTGLCLSLQAGLASAQADPPGRVGRMADFQGAVWVFEHEAGDWAAALRNRPVTTGDRISTGADARAELRVGSSVIRLAARSELEFVQLDDEHIRLQLHSGSAAVRIRSREVAEEVELLTAEARLKPMRAGHFRLDRQNDVTFAASIFGELLLDESSAFPISSGQRMEFWREGPQRQLRHRWSVLPQDALSVWMTRDDPHEQRSASSRYVSPEMTGAEELDRHGRWESHPDHGSLWVPISVQVGWAPYRFGTWVWQRPWGWTWVDAQPWGFAPFHYGRWVSWRGRWCWAPGVYAPRPVFAPALVSWVGGPQHGVSAGVVIGTRGRPLPAAGWAPLAPHQAYTPHHVASPVYVERINHGHGPREPHARPIPPRPMPPMTAMPTAPEVATVMPAVPPPMRHNPRGHPPGAPHAGEPQAPPPRVWQPHPMPVPAQPRLTPPTPPTPPTSGVVPGATAPAVAPPQVTAPGAQAPSPRHERQRREHDAAAPPGREDAPRVKAPESQPGLRNRERERHRERENLR